jgi:hypothetical protein
MAAALERADRLLAVCTEAYSTSAFGGAELRAAFARHPVAEGRIVPVLIEPVTLPPLYATLNSLDLTGLDEAAAAARLRGRLAGTRPTGPAPFPRRVKPAGLSTSLGHAAPSDRRRFRPEFATAVPRDAACFVPSGANVTGRTDAGLNDRDPRVGRRRRRGEVGDEGLARRRQALVLPAVYSPPRDVSTGRCGSAVMARVRRVACPAHAPPRQASPPLLVLRSRRQARHP